MTTIVLPVGEYIRGDTLPPFCVRVDAKIPGLSVISARMNFIPNPNGSPALSFTTAGDDANVTIGPHPLGGQLLTFQQTDEPAFDSGLYIADLEVKFSNNFRKTLFRATLDVKEDVTR